MSGLCPECDEEYDSLGTHFRYNESHRPSISGEQHEVVTGLLLGDGCLYGRRDNGNKPFLTVTLSPEQAIDHLREIFGCLSRNKQEVYTDGRKYHRFETRSHPELETYLDWYQPDKIWPEDVELTPTAMKWLYVSDGTYDTSDGHRRVMIACAKEGEHTDKIERIFEQSGNPISRTYHYERDGRKDDYQLHFNASEAEQLFEYMGEPVPGFEYKWPNRNP